VADQIFLLDAAKTALRSIPRTTVQAWGVEEITEWIAPCYGVEHSGAAAMHLHIAQSLAFSRTVSSPIFIGSTVVCS
jgi:hypothetical protein